MKKTVLKIIIGLSAIAFLYQSCQKDYNIEDEAASGYYGTRSSVAVRAILLQQFPQLDPNTSLPWDSISSYDSVILGPDIFYSIKDDVTDTLVFEDFFQHSQFENVIQDSLPLVYFLTSEYAIPVFGRNMLFSMYDLEKADSDTATDITLMTQFNLSVSPGDTLVTNNPYPDSLVLENADYRLLLYLNWKK